MRLFFNLFCSFKIFPNIIQLLMSEGKRSKKMSYHFHSLYLNDGTNEIAKEHYHSVLPSFAGDLKYSVTNTDHNGWLKCDGRSISRESFPELFNAIGTSFGSVDSDSFNLPDCRGRVLGAIGQGTGLTNRILGSSTGSETHTLNTSQMPSHSHTGTTDSSGTHTHTSNANGGSLGLSSSDGNNTASGGLDFTSGEPNLYATPTALTINSSGAHTHTFTTSSVGGGNSFNIIQPTVFISNVFIFSK